MAANVFDSLPQYLQNRIDQAFDAVAAVEEVETGAGFIVENKADRISMSDLPTALQALDLAPDDEQVLAVFRNAATGWSASSSLEVDDTAARGGWVSREDWRAVCAVLLEHYSEEYRDDSDGVPLQQQDSDLESDDQYIGDEDDDENNDSDDEYTESPSTSTARRRTRARNSSPPASPQPSRPSDTGKLTKRQREVALEAFKLFFPDVSLEDVPKQRIMIKDLQRVAKLLGEKIKADEMVEMLEAFSTAADKSVSLEDFGRIMLAARLA